MVDGSFEVMKYECSSCYQSNLRLSGGISSTLYITGSKLGSKNENFDICGEMDPVTFEKSCTHNTTNRMRRTSPSRTIIKSPI